MAATITNALKNFILDEIKKTKDSSSNPSKFYAAIGRSQNWDSADTVPDPQLSLKQERDFRNNMQAVRLISDASFVVPRYNWSSGTFYDAYDDTTVGNSSAYYVVNSNQQVYMVLRKSINDSGTAVASTVEPTGNTTGTPFKTSDGYVWKMVYSIGSASANKFQSANFIPVQLINNGNVISVGDSSNFSTQEIEQSVIQTNAVDGQIVGYAIDNPGAGYGSAPTITITGNGSSASATATISGGEVVKVIPAEDGSGNFDSANFGSGYRYAAVSVSGGSPTTAAIVRPILAKTGGIGANAIEDLKSNALMFNSKPVGAEGNDFGVGIQFRQVGLLKDPDSNGGASPLISTTGQALKRLSFSAITTAFEKGKTLLGGTSGAKAIADYDSGAGSSTIVYYHQNDSTGFASFSAGETVTTTEGAAVGDGVLKGAGLIDSSGNDFGRDVDPYSGELLYIDNRSAVTRAADQTEDLKIVIQV